MSETIFIAAKVWFEVSPHTSRLHFHAAKDGSAPFGLSLPMGALQGTGVSASLQDLLQALDTRQALVLHAVMTHDDCLRQSQHTITM